MSKRKPNSNEIYSGINLLNEILMMNNELKASSKNLIPDQIIPRMRELRSLLDRLDLQYYEYYNGLKS